MAKERAHPIRPVDAERFELYELLGAGGMGVVYRARDRVRGTDVAVKMMRFVDGPALYRFKREFRALSDIRHTNLVELYELRGEGDEWFFSMELIDGVDFLSWVRPRSRAKAARVHGEGDDTESTAVVNESPRDEAPLDETRLRDGLRQVAAGLHALHRAGKLHRDIKPSNVLVNRRGRVAISDFGLVTDAPEAGIDATWDAKLVGTPSYMSPEQAANTPLTPASDWYSVGVLLFHALTGRRPFEGERDDILHRKQGEDPPSPRDLQPDAPADLDALCRRLLERDPAARPTGGEVLASLGALRSRRSSAVEDTINDVFVGRERELAALREAFDAARTGPIVATVHGRSGMGKSALIARFLDEVRGESDAVVLAGRCYERESVPYKAIDTIIDELSSYLLKLSDVAVEALVPDDAAVLTKVFPVLRRVPAIAQPRRRELVPPDAIEVRRRAFAALRRLLERIARVTPLVLFIDDLQWGDVDSAPFFTDLVEQEPPVCALIVAGYRDEDVARSPLLGELRLSRDRAADREALRDIELGPFAEADARALIEQLSGGRIGVDDSSAGTLMRETGGHPYLLRELASQLAREGGAVPTGLELDELLRARIDGLGEGSRSLLSVCAVAGKPLPVLVLARAARIDDVEAAIGALRAARLIKVHRVGELEELEPYHDRIRGAVLSALTQGERVALHDRIAAELESGDDTDDVEALVDHLLAAGAIERVGPYARAAAERADEAFAFARAAHYYSVALQMKGLEPEERRELLARRGVACARAGRLRDAADSLLEASSFATGSESMALRRLAVEQLLRAADLERGLAGAEELFGEVGMRLPRTARGVLLGIGWGRLRIKLRGFRFAPLSPEEIDVVDLQRLETCWSVASGLAFVDPMLGTWAQLQYVRYALRVGDIGHVVLAFTLELGFRSIDGDNVREKVDAWARRTIGLAEATRRPDLIGRARSMKGLALFLRGDWQQAIDIIETSERLLLEECAEITWELDLCRIFRSASLVYVGRFRELSQLMPRWIRQAEEQGDEYLLTGLRGWRSNVLWLALDDVAEARRQASLVATPRRVGKTFHLQHYYELLCQAQIDLYDRRGEAAWERIAESWRLLERSMLLRLQSVRIEANYLRGRAALATAGEHPERLGVAERSIRAIERENSHWGPPVARLLRGCLCLARGERDAADELFRVAAAEFRVADMAMYAAVADYRRGLVDEAAEAMRAEAIAAPARFAQLFAPLAGGSD